MKKILAIALFVGAFAFTSSAQFKFGPQAALLFDGSYFGIGGKGHYSFNEDWAGQGSFTYYFESDITVWTLDLDVHYSGFNIGDVESFRITPFAGINIFNVSADTGLGFNVGGNSTNINIGVNGTMPIGDNLEFFVEPKFIIGGGGTLGIAAGVYF